MIALAPNAVVPRQSTPAPPRQFVVFSLAGESYALPVSQVREVIRPQKITLLPKAGKFIEGVISLRGRVIALVDLRRRFELAAEQAQSTRVVIARLPHTLVGLVVDGVREVLSLPLTAIQPTPSVMAHQPVAAYASGIARIDQKLIVMLDLNALFSAEESQHMAQLQTEHASRPATKPNSPKGNGNG